MRSSLTIPDSQWLISAAALRSFLHPPAPSFPDPAPKQYAICVCVCVCGLCVGNSTSLRPGMGQARGESRPIHRHKDIINQIGKWFEKLPLEHCVLVSCYYRNTAFVTTFVSVCLMSI